MVIGCPLPKLMVESCQQHFFLPMPCVFCGNDNQYLYRQGLLQHMAQQSDLACRETFTIHPHSVLDNNEANTSLASKKTIETVCFVASLLGSNLSCYTKCTASGSPCCTMADS